MTPDQGQTSQWAQQGGFIPGPFGWQAPVPPKTPDQSNDLPSFQFSKDDFQTATTSNNQTEYSTNEIIDPFANGIASLTTTTSSPTTQDTIIDGEIKQQDVEINREEDSNTIAISNIEQPIETVQFELPNTQVEKNINENRQDTNNQINEDKDDIKINDNDFTLPPMEETTVPSKPEVSFDLPVSEDNSISETTEPEANTDHTIWQEDLSFELPVSDTPIATDTDTTIDTDATIATGDKEINKSDGEKWDYLTETEVTNNSWDDNTSSDSTEPVETPIIQEETITEQEENNMKIDEGKIEEDTTTSTWVNEPVNEEVYTDDDISPLSEEYNTFVKELTWLLQFKNNSEVSILAHRTDEDEIQYNFHKDNNTITVKRNYIKLSDNSSEEQVLSFNNDDGLQVSLNEDNIAHYWREEEDSDITYYLKDKLNKFIAIITDEEVKEEKRLKEEKQKKKIKIEVLRSF